MSLAVNSVMAQRVGYRLQNRVPKGTKPSVVLQAGEPIKKLELTLKRSDGRAERHVRKNLKDGQEVTISFAQGEGTYDYEATLKMWTAAGQSSTSFKFDVVVAKRVSVEVDKSLTSLDEKRVTLRADGAVSDATMVVESEGEVVTQESFDLSGVKPGKDIVLTWSEGGDAKITRINIKVNDPAGFWTGVELIPFSVDIPHEEVNFDSGKSSFGPDEARKLDDTLKHLNEEIAKYGKDLEIHLYVAGYTDTQGARQSNISLSFARARAICGYFRKKGLKIPIYYQGFGEDVLAVKTADNVDEARNRRALYILGNFAPSGTSQIPRGDWRRLQ